MKLALKTAVAVLAMVTATPSFAALTIVAPCSSTTPNPDATACAGFYAGNLLNSASIADINLALDALVGGNFPDVVFSNLDPTKVFFSGSGDDPNAVVTFQSALSGDVIIGANFGDAGTGLGPRTVFYRFNFGSPTTSVAFNTQGFSGGVLVQGTPVPEAATWAMMLVGFAGIGFAMRRRRITLPQIA